MQINYSENALEIASALVGKTVRYLANKSKIKKDGVRVFKVEMVENVSVSTNGHRYVTALVRDIDDKGEVKYRNMRLEGIDLIV
jgi:hypothetical protein